jgi:hypothetical protein
VYVAHVRVGCGVPELSGVLVPPNNISIMQRMLVSKSNIIRSPMTTPCMLAEGEQKHVKATGETKNITPGKERHVRGRRWCAKERKSNRYM